ncbi:hypothetical protein A3K93_05190 [Acinetobacter sp. NCu2D-2]|uniref:DUF3426 domain-containing protein n=1 Tax=Acinetobacter sp. NCu2D-2 TaxID=1608473 RepID=UPI0007CDB956|nr:DUF3426 domain-containing protein [Acinetobacter sp. NCu2D-2]ANF81638.1 hypothetical protein A3K93_05190 [Acinetobacter sp. NCu2D-2]
MSDKRTYCPTCSTTYKVTVAQLTLAQGMVCCPKCTTSFNALSHLVTEPKRSVAHSDPAVESLQPISQAENEILNNNYQPRTPSDVNSILNIFDEKVENSNIDLKTYLNNLNYFSTEPINVLPAVDWEANTETGNKRGLAQYAMWTVLNLALFGLFVFQFFWFNPQYLKHSHVMSTAFNSICDVFNCSNLQEHYNLINTKKVKVENFGSGKTKFSGELINYYERSLAMPLIRVDLKEDGMVQESYTLTPEMYLTESFKTIQRIPQNSPFKFEFDLPVKRGSFDSYTLEIIRP